jgi:electron transfer flavoprotein alpha subunit
MSVRQNTFLYSKADNTAGKKAPAVVYHSPKRKEASGVRLVKRELKPDTDDIRESDVLISGGGGVMRSFNRLEALAKELDGMVSASRRVVDSGAAPRHIQVGQSGKTVSPRLYLALGISGSIQHVVGLKNAEYIISVNSDRHAPICSLSDIVVEGDARDFIERMIQRLQQDGQTDPS